ncbi:hypothetical protein HanRHA438_Chr09g0424201 [Helianthus annuus]|nr:hypothetical protein HanRHA438_Chr09g0424201 [Helianthus annuus]
MLSVIHVQFFNLGQNSEFDFEVQCYHLYMSNPLIFTSYYQFPRRSKKRR